MNNTKVQDNSLLQKTYVQKSMIFLLPLTGIRKDKIFRPINTYLSSKDLISKEYPSGITHKDCILIVNYPKSYRERSESLLNQIAVQRARNVIPEELESAWERFELEYILSNPMFLGIHETHDEFIYTFDFSRWKADWGNFLKGRYSLLSQSAKDRIINYRWDTLRPTERKKLFCYLHPGKDECIRAFSEQLDVPEEELKTVRELCNKPDLKLEHYHCELCFNTKEALEKDENKD